MPELLVELLSEEIPARMQARAADDLRRLVTDGLKGAGLEFTEARAFVTPRRLALVVDGIPSKQPAVTEERRGPRADAPERAIQGFLKGNGLTLDQCEKRTTPKGDFLFAVIEKKGQATEDVMKALLPTLIFDFPWPKGMYWGEKGAVLRWIRPLRRVLCLFGGESISISEKLVAIDSTLQLPPDNNTVGHRFLSPEPFKVRDFADYEAKLREVYVMLDADERRKAIAGQAEKLAKKEKLAVMPDDALLAEVAGLVEWPVALMGRIDEAFMDLPEEVLSTAMRHHQKYFSVVDAKGKLAPRFIVVANTEATDGGKAIIAGNERVLRARLADARYFWDQDRKRSLESRVADLSGMVFQEKLGSVADKAERMAALARVLAEHTGADADLAERAGRLAKADLTTEMVVEFPVLQGVMGRYYALADGDPAEVAEAIADHYAPQGPADRCPSAPVSVAVALADKIDSLVGFWAIDEKPTGSKDPYALRRAALGVIRLIVDNGHRLPLRTVFLQACSDSGFRADTTKYGWIVAELLDFFAERLKVQFRDRGVRHDLISAVFAQRQTDFVRELESSTDAPIPGEVDLIRVLARVDALSKFLDTKDGADLLVAYRRAANIVRDEEKKDGEIYQPAVYQSGLAEGREFELWSELERVRDDIEPTLEREEFEKAMKILSRLRGPVDKFFEEVRVNVEAATLRENRLCLLSYIVWVMDLVADFSKIEG